MDYPWQVSIPSNVLISGGSGTGKSSFVQNLLGTPQIWQTPVTGKTMYCFGINSENVKYIHEKFPHVELIEGIPRNLDRPLEIFSPSQPNLIIFDDLSPETQSSKVFTDFLIKGSHHSNTCLISLEHFLYSQAKERSRQAPHWHQLILFRNPRTLYQIATLARQCSVADPKLVVSAYRDATQKKFSYLIIDLRNETVPELRLLTNALHENEEPVYIYM